MLDKIPLWNRYCAPEYITSQAQLSCRFPVPGTVVRMLKSGINSSTKGIYLQLKYCCGLPQVFCVAFLEYTSSLIYIKLSSRNGVCVYS